MNLGGSAGDMGEGQSRVNAVRMHEILNHHGNEPLTTTQFFDIRPYPIVSFFSTYEYSVRFSEPRSWVCPSLCIRETSYGKLIRKNRNLLRSSCP